MGNLGDQCVYRRHTNFSVEPIQQVFNGAPDFGRTVTCNLNRNGDLITNMYSVVQLRASSSPNQRWGYVRRLGYALIHETKVEIGGSKIDEQYGDWLNIWQELTIKVGQVRGHAAMIGDVSSLKNFQTSHSAYTMYVPLGYWFNRHNGLALPLIALQYHDVRVTIQYENAANCINWDRSSVPASLPSNFGMADSYLLIDYVYLDSEERKRFAQASHEYLIEQLQFTGSEALTSGGNKYRLNFNHPSKFLIWVPKLSKYNNVNRFVAYADDGDWKAATDRCAKLVWLASREGLTDGSGGTSGAGIDVSGEFYVPVSSPTVSTSQPGVRALANATLKALAAKVNAQMMFATGDIDGAAAGTSSGYVASPDNVVLLKNELNSEDISTLVSVLTVGDAVATNFFAWNDFRGQNNLASADGQGNAYAHSVCISDQFNYGRWLDGSVNPVANGKLQLNGHDRFQEREGSYFNYVQPWQHFSNTPADGINVYSFALKPEDHQPSGTCNFSRIDNATLQVNLVNSGDAGTDSNLNIYTVNYNVLRVMSGMAGTAYSN